MNVAFKTSEFKQVIPASLPQVDRVCDELKAFLNAQDLGGYFFGLSLMLREALVNAVVHGCSMDEKHCIGIEIQCDDQGIVMVIEDPGPGFDWRRLQLKQADVLQDHGRGMLIFRCYATDVAYNDKGNQLTLRKSY